MRLTRNLLLGALAALSAMAVLTTSAFAQSVTMHPEGSSEQCGIVQVGANHTVTGGCLIHGTSEDNAQTFFHVVGVGEVETSSCTSEFAARVGPAGGYILTNDTVLNTGAGNCVVTPCDEAEPGETSPHDELEWPLSGLFEYGSSREALVATFCIRAANTAEGTGSFCTIIVNITAISGHRHELTASDSPCFETGGLTEISGHWLGEATPGPGEVDIQLEHIHYP